MNFKKILITLCAMIIVAPSSFAAVNNISSNGYFAIGVGGAFPANKIKNLKPINEPEGYEKVKLKNNVAFKAALGTNYEEMRGEIEYMFLSHKLKHNEVSVVGGVPGTFNHHFKTQHHLAFLNGYFDFKNVNAAFVPYVTVGIGLAHNRISKERVVSDAQTVVYKKKTNNSFAYNAGLGVMAPISDLAFLDLNYKYVNVGKMPGTTEGTTLLGAPFSSANKNVKGNLGFHTVMVSLGLKF